MPFDLSVTISMHFYERCQTKWDVWNFRFEKGDSSSKVRLSVSRPRGGGGGTLIFLGVFIKLNMFGGIKILWIFFGVIRKLDYTMHFRVFVWRWRYKMEDIFWVAKISNIYLGCLNSWYFLGVNSRCWARAYVWRKNESTPPQFKPIPVKCI